MGSNHYLTLLPEVPECEPTEVTFLLGTDRHIGESINQPEKRVGTTPDQIGALRKWLRSASINLRFYFVEGTGEGAGFSDGDYIDVGGRAVPESELSSMPRPDVVHALKEPCPYEMTIPGPFNRIGALHAGTFDPTRGLACLLKSKNFAAIFDGSNVGGYYYKLYGGYKIPIRSSMSKFAGTIAAKKVGQKMSTADFQGKVVISGGGVAGTAAVTTLLEFYHHLCNRILIIEESAHRCERLQRQFGDNPTVAIKKGMKVYPDDLKNAYGLILTAYRSGYSAPKVVNLNDLAQLSNGAVIVDISIDEGGCIVPASQDSLLNLEKTVFQVNNSVLALDKNIEYIADAHMPRIYPAEASEAHGISVLPYLATLLYLSAREGGATQAVNHIADFEISQPSSSQFEALIYDLRNGIACRGSDPVYLNQDIMGAIMPDIERYLCINGVA